jgi:hypothetical protein
MPFQSLWYFTARRVKRSDVPSYLGDIAQDNERAKK